MRNFSTHLRRVAISGAHQLWALQGPKHVQYIWQRLIHQNTLVHPPLVFLVVLVFYVLSIELKLLALVIL